MLLASHDLQIARTIVEFVSISMMHYFIGAQRSTYLLACNITMDSHITIVARFGTTRLILLFIAFFINIRFMPS